MSEFLLEIYSEEIPARMQKKAALDFKQLFLDFFEKEEVNVDPSNIESFIATRRIVLFIKSIDALQTSKAIQKTGPKINAPQKAIEGFARSVGATNIKDLEIINNSKGEYYAFNQEESKTNTTDILAVNLVTILQKMSNLWPKNMRWHADKKQPKWVRPIRSILAIFDGKIVDFEFANIKSSNKTLGHLFLCDQSLQVKSFADYAKQLKENFVILSNIDRRDIICKDIENICTKKGLKLVDRLDENNKILDEAIGLADFPQVSIGQIDEEFMSLPKEILILTAKLHQKYFCLEDKKGNLAPYFIFVSNVKITNKIILDNQKVLRARLNDAKFFIDEDLKTSFAQRSDNLKDIIFHAKLGTLHDKIKRLEILNKYIAFWIPNTDLAIAEKLAGLAKNDLTTKCVAELPELQGIVGGYYSKMQSEELAVSKAISEQYLPLGPSSPLPKTPLGSLLALSDKIDTICGLFLVGEKPTSSKDPLALRRAALGIVRIIIHNNISIPLRIVIGKSINSFPVSLIRKSHKGIRGKELKDLRRKATHEVIEFITERIKSILKDSFKVRSDIANVLLDDYMHKIKEAKKLDINKLVKKAQFINAFVNDKSSDSIISLYKRAVNIVTIEEKKDQKTYDSKPHILSIRDQYEKKLYKKVKAVCVKVRKLGKAGEYDGVFKLFQELEQPLNDFFDNVIVNAPESNIRENRLLILGKIKTLFNGVFNFSKIEK